MQEYEFTLRFVLPDTGIDPSEYVEHLGDTGCDDALIGIGHPGRIALTFTRGADSARDALIGALTDVRRAIPGAVLVEAKPDLVGLTDVAELLGFTRQNMRKLTLGSDGVPAPVHEGRPSIWHLATLLLWLRDHKGYVIDEGLLELAQVTMQLNIAVECRNTDEPVQKEIQAILA